MLLGSLGNVPGLTCRMWVWTSRAVAAPRRKARIGMDGLDIVDGSCHCMVLVQSIVLRRRCTGDRKGRWAG